MSRITIQPYGNSVCCDVNQFGFLKQERAAADWKQSKWKHYRFNHIFALLVVDLFPYSNADVR